MPDILITGPSLRMLNSRNLWKYSSVPTRPFSQDTHKLMRRLSPFITVKNLLRKANDTYVAILMYWATPLQNGPAESNNLIGRKLNTKLPYILRNWQPKNPDAGQLM
ncbi:Pol polyprotein [Plakobranchus ocellatus]|uniref:Pol polyprotein n=1 Tax=Plakobranchus ocellatus TaxID=259542 RepID=A0AAV3ZF79_9GAST|nr:Pol polyprotein [Plakobranchus ocellatus]